LTCEACGYNDLDVHRTRDSLVTYCQNCGNETNEKRTDNRERWTQEQRDLRLIQGGGKPKAIGALIPLPDKKKKKRRG
jgi:hypothetical protein